MKQNPISLRNAYILVFLILAVDQISKIYIKTHFVLGEEVEVFSWFKIYFIENEGMAWGVKIPGQFGKIILTSFRLIMLPFLGYWLYDTIRKNGSNYLRIAIVLIIAGNLGNIIDSVFYGVIFDDSYQSTATLFSDKPYGTWFHGKVVDMLYFPIWHGNLPEWLPIWGGKEFTFFNAIFNVADVAISSAMGVLLFFNKSIFPENRK